MSELLSICIPTYNRAGYLADVLESLAREHAADPWGEAVVVHVSDNASTDTTPAVVAAYASRLPLRAQRNPTNIGGERNFARLIDLTEGVYFWLLGDDETVAAGSLAGLLALLRTREHGLVLLPSVRTDADGRLWAQPYTRHLSDAAAAVPMTDETFPDYAAYVQRHHSSNPFALIGHSLISYNVIRRDCFDRGLLRRTLGSEDVHYAHMFGLVGGLRRTGARVHLLATPVVVVREERAPVAASRLLIRRTWSRYLQWLGREFQQPGLVRYGRSLFRPTDRLNFLLRKLTGRLPPGWGRPLPGD